MLVIKDFYIIKKERKKMTKKLKEEIKKLEKEIEQLRMHNEGLWKAWDYENDFADFLIKELKPSKIRKMLQRLMDAEKKVEEKK